MSTATKNRLNGHVSSIEHASVVSPVASNREFITFDIESTAPMLQMRMDPTTILEIFNKQNGIPFTPRNLTPEQKFLECLHIIGKRPERMGDLLKSKFAIPAISFKQAAIRGASMNDKKMTDARIFMYVIPDEAELIQIHAQPPTMRIDGVRTDRGDMIPRITAEFKSWKATFKVRYLRDLVSDKEMIAIFDTAGQFVGVGASRPFGQKSTGTCGTFKVVNAIASKNGK